MDLDRRKMKILGAIVSEYIRTGEPVGSKRVSQLLDTQVSPATCRNEMSLLFDLGLLEQPHTSAGRIPSHLGFRVYLDKLLTCDQKKMRSTRCLTFTTPIRTACWPTLRKRWPGLPDARPCRRPAPRGM